jgi:hypothetical protein
MNEEIYVSDEEIYEYLFTRLIEAGYAPIREEVEEMAGIVFDFLLDKGIIGEVE